jgi:epoxyqueuosine reductase QueG
VPIVVRIFIKFQFPDILNGKEKIMISVLKDLFEKEGIVLYQSIPFSKCKLTKPHLIKDAFSEPQSVLMLAVPYHVRGKLARLSEYAVSYDYHLYFDNLFEKCLDLLRKSYPNYWFCAFADHSPIAEREAAQAANLGEIGENGLLLTNPYGSYVFLGEIISNLPFGEQNEALLTSPTLCIHCGKCKVSCPSHDNCLSSITQKKQALTEREIGCMKQCNTAWGCDICQEVCPVNAYIDETPISFFRENRLQEFSVRSITDMPQEEFEKRAFSWRGKEVVLRNLRLLEE